MPQTPNAGAIPSPTIEVLALRNLPPSFNFPGLILHQSSGSETLDALVHRVGDSIRAIVMSGSHSPPATDELMARLPRLEIIVVVGAGYDLIDLQAAARRGLTVTNTPDVLNEDVADLALGLLLATVRRIPQADRFVRAGEWALGAFPLSHSVQGRFVGIVGLGRVGKAVAQRCRCLGLEVGYFGRSRQESPYAYFDSLVDLARRADVLMITVTGGTPTRGLVNAEVMAALGKNGVVINVARGGVVDEPALVDALQSGQLQAAGLDVHPEEPRVNPLLLEMSNVVLLPHIGSATRETRSAMVALALKNLVSWCEGRGPVTPVRL